MPCLWPSLPSSFIRVALTGRPAARRDQILISLNPLSEGPEMLLVRVVHTFYDLSRDLAVNDSLRAAAVDVRDPFANPYRRRELLRASSCARSFPYRSGVATRRTSVSV